MDVDLRACTLVDPDCEVSKKLRLPNESGRSTWDLCFDIHGNANSTALPIQSLPLAGDVLRLGNGWFN